MTVWGYETYKPHEMNIIQKVALKALWQKLHMFLNVCETHKISNNSQ
jgi:hypothetical protein